MHIGGWIGKATPVVDAPKEGRWIARPLKPRLPFAYFHTAINLIYVLSVFAFLLMNPKASHLPVWLVSFNVIGLVGVGLLHGANEVRCLRTTKADLARSERPEGLDEFLVEITLESGPERLGGDRGVVYFDGGRMGFVGSRTSFLLATTDLNYPNVRPPFDLDLPLKPLSLRAEGKNGTVTIKPLLGQGRRFRQRIRRFLRDRESSQGERQWPPLAPYEESSKRGIVGVRR